ncbi:MAG: rod shape-determining protein RodA [Sphingopyxis sp.]
MSRTIVPHAIAQAFPWKLVALLMALAGFGSLVLYSAAGGSLSPWSSTHMLRFAVLLCAAFAISYVPEMVWRRVAVPLYAILALALLGVELLGAVSGGSQRWLNLGVIRLQPSEFMKLSIVVVVAHFYSMLPPGHVRTWQALWPAGVLVGVPLGLVMLQPDLGTAIAIAVGGVTVGFLAGLPMRLFVGGGLAGAAAVPVLFSLLHGYQQKRILIFLDPESDPLGSGYHITQSKIAIGSGGVFGKGFLNGTQSHLDYLPEGHTDFVFATMAEEWGLLGGLLLLTGFFLLLRWGWRVANRANTRFGRLVAGGLTMVIFFYICINMMMVMGLAPVVGIPLPFMSYGGSSMLTVLLCIGIIMGVDRQSRYGSGELN